MAVVRRSSRRIHPVRVRLSHMFLATVLFWLGQSLALRAAEPGDSVVVVYNQRLPESKKLADYYAQRRRVPTNQVFGFDLPTGETISRAEFREHLQRPLLNILESQKFLSFKTTITPATREKPGEIVRAVTAAKIRYLALCYGVPLRILSDPNLIEEGMEKIQPELRRNEAAVDSELALLPFGEQLRLFGPLRNPVYDVNDSQYLSPTNGVLLVARLDGPTVEIARGLIDKALQGESDCLLGRAYFDLRGLTNGDYKMGDDWLRGATQVVRRLGFETIVDEKPETFPASFPLSQVAFYAGWYDGNVSGPFARSEVEFMPGAIAYHLHSYSAHTIRTLTQYWVGPLLAKGATATMGCVEEPYLEGTPDVSIFFSRLLKGFSFGEAAYAAQNSLSWQTTVVGDPLYRPFGKLAAMQHAELFQRKSQLIEWSHLRIVNLNMAAGVSRPELIEYLEKEPTTSRSAVLREKLGDLFDAEGDIIRAVTAYTDALKLEPSSQQRVRLILALTPKLLLLGRNREACDLYRQFVKNFPDYPDLLPIYQKLLPLARQFGKKTDVELYQREISRLSAQTAKP